MYVDRDDSYHNPFRYLRGAEERWLWFYVVGACAIGWWLA